MKYVLLLFFIASCADVPIKDAEWCGDMGPLGASCFHTLTEETRDIDKKTWDFERFGQVCTEAQTFADVEASIRKLCSAATVRCSYQVEEILNHMAENLEVLQDASHPAK